MDPSCAAPMACPPGPHRRAGSRPSPQPPRELWRELLPDLATPGALLLVQDLDGVCMDLVLDPLQRQLEPGYVLAARQLDGRFCVLTNGEHGSQRGVNRLVERALGPDQDPQHHGLYLPGLAAGGVQLQDRFGTITTPGVLEAELAFLAALPARMRDALRAWLPAVLPWLDVDALEGQVNLAVQANPLSPTLNLHGLFACSAPHDRGGRPLAAALQEGGLALMQALLATASEQGLEGCFTLHLAPSVIGPEGEEDLVRASAAGIGTTDVQCLLQGAVKEAGLLVLINEHIARHHGHHPLGADFNVRTAPRSQAALLALAEAQIPPALMPRLVGIGDTITSRPGPAPGQWERGGSDRGFLTLVQELGRRFDRPNRVVLVDSSGGEVQRPSLASGDLAGLSDPDDPLQLDVLFPGGPAQYRSFFVELAAQA